MSLLMTLTAVVAGTVAIWGSVIGCKVVRSDAPSTAVPVSTPVRTVVLSQQPQQQQPSSPPVIASTNPGK